MTTITLTTEYMEKLTTLDSAEPKIRRKDDVNHVYIYVWRDSQDAGKQFLVYDRSVPDVENAERIVQRYRREGKVAFYTINCTVKGAFY